MKIEIQCNSQCGGMILFDTTQMGPVMAGDIFKMQERFYEEHRHTQPQVQPTTMEWETPDGRGRLVGIVTMNEAFEDDQHQAIFDSDKEQESVFEDQPVDDVLDDMDTQIEEVTNGGG